MGAKGFFTDTTLCIGCKACEVACKQWNQLPDDGFSFTGMSYDNTVALGASTWRHVAFIERPVALSTQDAGAFSWLFSSDVCKHCARAGCLESCPTGAIVGPGIVDARRCLAWLVQAPGPIPIEFRVALGIRLYGCDDCQEVCPPNRRQDRIRSAGFRAGDTALVPILELLALTDTEILDRHGRWYIAERDPRYLRRNALVALGNANDRAPIVLDVLRKFASGADSLLAEHAQWSLDQLVSPTFSEPTS